MRKFTVMLALWFGAPGWAHAAFVQLDGNGNVVGMYANPQPAIPGVQQIPDNDPRVAAFQSAQAKLLTAQPAADRLKRLADLLVAKGVITSADEAALLGP
jgi:hypothetical protein